MHIAANFARDPHTGLLVHGHVRQDLICADPSLMLNRAVDVVAGADCVDRISVSCGASNLWLLLNLVALVRGGPNPSCDRLLLVFWRRSYTAILLWLVLLVIFISLSSGRAGLKSTTFLEEVELRALLEWILIKAVMVVRATAVCIAMLVAGRLLIRGVDWMIANYSLRIEEERNHYTCASLNSVFVFTYGHVRGWYQVTIGCQG